MTSRQCDTHTHTHTHTVISGKDISYSQYGRFIHQAKSFWRKCPLSATVLPSWGAHCMRAMNFTPFCLALLGIRHVLKRLCKIPQKTIISFTISVCPSVRLHWTAGLPLDGFSWNLVSFFFFEKSVEKIKVPLKSGHTNRYFTGRPTYIHDHTSLTSS